MTSMESTVFWILCLLTFVTTEVQCIPTIRSLPVAINYAELEDLDASCYPMDTCHKPKSQGGMNDTSCDCDSSCSVYDTCCLDSEFRSPTISYKAKNSPKCLRVHGSQLAVFMVDSCKSYDASESQCFDDPEESNDPFLMIPATSKVSGITYKNYFCAVCNEEVETEQLDLWDINVFGNGTLLKNSSRPLLKYDKTIKSWTISEEKHYSDSHPIPVTLLVNQSAKATVRFCSSDLIEDCASNWSDISVKEKCKAYMAKVSISKNNADIRYRNPHCAICNFEDLSFMECLTSPGRVSATSLGPLMRLFVLENGEKRCGRNMIYDKLADKCRCNTRLYKRQNGKCVSKV